MKRLPALLAVGLAVLLSGCATSAQPTPTADPVFLFLVDEEERLARLNGASDAQLADIATARAEGKVSFALYVAAVNRVEACLMELGDFEVVNEYVMQSGILSAAGYINYPPGMEDSQGAEIYNQCDTQEAHFIRSIYGSQPVSVEAFSDLVARHQDAIRACLAREGIAASEMETIAELMEQSQHLTLGQSTLGADSPVDCLGESGIAW